MNPPTADSNFEKFRKDRRQRRAQFHGATATAPRTHGARDAEAYEARQVHETRLTRDVHDFLAEATKHAASIVERVTSAAEAETAQRLAREMQEFLQETMRRAATFMHMVQAMRGKAAVQDLEPHVSNLVGEPLDGFRFEGTAQLSDKHIGQDPFAEPIEPAPEAEPESAAASAIDEALATADKEAPAPDSKQEQESQTAALTPGPTPAALLMARIGSDPETLKRSLKALVQSRALSTDEARAIYRDALAKKQA
jgi:hypothetical protein